MKKRALFGLFLILVIGVGVAGVLMIRKDLPYDLEIAYGPKSFLLRNQTPGLHRSLEIRVEGPDRFTDLKVLNPGSNEARVAGLNPGKAYRVTISRLDPIGKVRYKPRTFGFVAARIPYVVLVGASVGQAWKFYDLPNRVKNHSMLLGYRFGERGFDKEDVLEELARSEVKPDGVIIKECAAYFPRNIRESVSQIERWIEIVRGAGIVPILATVPPVTKEHGDANPGRQASINEFNVEIRKLGQRHSISILDLNKALADDSDQHYLRDDFSTPDGLHLNNTAYATSLDAIVIPEISPMFQAR